MESKDKNFHSVYDLNYTLIVVIKKRRNVINDEISARLKEIFLYISKKYQIKLIEWSANKDYLHINFKAKPVSALSTFINAFKSTSSRLIKVEYPDIIDNLYKGNFWSQSFYLFTTGVSDIEKIQTYIEGQNEGRYKK